MWSAWVLAVGLAMDAAAASAVRGMAARVVRRRDVVAIAGLTGGFQAGMAALGWLAGERVGAAVARYDHWIAFAILALLGGKAVWAALHPDLDAPAEAPFAPWGLVGLAVATSIDALAAGVTLPLLPVPGGVAIALIGGVTAALSALGVIVGRVAGRRLGGKLEVVGGLALIAIGTKILIDGLAG